MTIRHLRVFAEVADTGKMSLAARNLYVAQATVSQVIAEIEREYGVRLFERLSRKLYITRDGAELLRYARRILSQFDEMELQLRNSAQRRSLRVGASVTVGACVLADVVSRYESAHPGARVDVCVDNTSVIEEYLLKSQLDLGFVEGAVQGPELVAMPVVRDALVLVCGPSHPFAVRGVVPLQDLEGQDFVLRERGSGTRDTLLNRLREEGVSIHEKWSCHSAEAVKSAVASGQGLSVISRLLVEKEVAKGALCVVSLQGVELSRAFSLVYHKDKYLSEPIREFIRACEALAE